MTSLELSAHRDAAALAFSAPPLFWASTAPRNRSGGHHSNHHAAHAMSAAQRATLARLNQWDLCLYRHVRQIHDARWLGSALVNAEIAAHPFLATLECPSARRAMLSVGTPPTPTVVAARRKTPSPQDTAVAAEAYMRREGGGYHGHELHESPGLALLLGTVSVYLGLWCCSCCCRCCRGWGACKQAKVAEFQ